MWRLFKVAVLFSLIAWPMLFIVMLLQALFDYGRETTVFTIMYLACFVVYAATELWADFKE